MKQKLQEVQVSYRRSGTEFSQLKISSSTDAYKALKNIWNNDTISMYEEFIALYLDSSNHVLGYRLIGRGTTSICPVSSKIILIIGLKCHARKIILAHNHPSGNLEPSNQDISITRKIKEGGKFLEIDLLDHIIISAKGYFSFADEGMIDST